MQIASHQKRFFAKHFPSLAKKAINAVKCKETNEKAPSQVLYTVQLRMAYIYVFSWGFYHKTVTDKQLTV